MFGKKKKDDSQLTQEELARRDLIRKRCLGVLIVLDILIVIYLVAQIALVFSGK